MCTYPPNFFRFGVFRRPLRSENPHFYRFSTLSFCDGSAQRCRDKVERVCTTAHVQKLPCPTIPRSFRNSKAFTAKWRSQSLLFESVTDKQKTQKNQQKHRTFLPPGGARYPSPTELGMVIEEVRTLLAPRKHVRLRRIVLPLGALNIWGNAQIPKVKPPNSETPRPNLPKFLHLTEHEAAYKRW